MQVIIPSFGSWKSESCSISNSWQSFPRLAGKQLQGCGSNFTGRPAVKAKLQSSQSPKDRSGDAASQCLLNPLFAHSLSFLKKLCRRKFYGRLHSPSLLSYPDLSRQRKGSIVSLFGKWVKSPRDSQGARRSISPPNIYQKLSKFFRRSVWIAAILLVGGGLLYGQSKAQDYMEANIIPPLAIMVGAHLQRNVEFGRVEGLTPLGFRLGPSSVGTHTAEFSCGELPDVEIRIKPFASLQRGQLVVDAVLAQPCLLVSQKEDWSWLGIPSASEKKNGRHSSEPGIDSRTRTRRFSREKTAQRLAKERNLAARNAAERGYVMPSRLLEDRLHDVDAAMVGKSESLLNKAFNKVHNLLDEKKRGRAVAVEIEVAKNRFRGMERVESKLAFDEAEVPASGKGGGGVSIPALRMDAGKVESDVDDRLRKLDSDGDAEQVSREGISQMFLRASTDISAGQDQVGQGNFAKERKTSTKGLHWSPALTKARKWMNGQVVRPVGRLLLKKWNQKPLKPLSKSALQRRNLEQSAAASRSFFQRLDSNVFEEPVLNQEPPVRFGAKHVDSIGPGNFTAQAHGHENVSQGQTLDVLKLPVDEEPFTQASTLLAFKQQSGVDTEHLDHPVGTVEAENDSIGVIAKNLPGQREKKVEEGWFPVALETIHFKDGSLSLIAYGDMEPRVIQKVNGYVKLGNRYDHVSAHLTGRPIAWKTEKVEADGGKLAVKVEVDLLDQSWNVKVKGHNLFTPLLERLLEIPIEWSEGRATGEVDVWMAKEDTFPNFGGSLDVKGLNFQIWEAPSAFREVGGTICFQGQRLFFHNTLGWYGSVPLSVSGDFDLNPEDGEYRLSCQVSGVEVNSLMKTLNAQPPPYPLAGTVKAVVYCRGPLEAPIFEGTAETVANQVTFPPFPPTVAVQAIKQDEKKGAVAAYDRVPFSSAFASFTFNTDDCVADLYGIRATPTGGGELRGAGNMWICPEGEVDADAARIDCSGHFGADAMLRYYVPAGVELPPVSFGPVHGEAKIRGSILMPIFDIKWETPKAQGSLEGAHGDISVSREAITINSSAFAFDLFTKVHTRYPPISRHKSAEWKPAVPPTIEMLDLDAKLRGFDIMGLSPSSMLPSSASHGGVHMKVTGKIKFQGRVPENGHDISSQECNRMENRQNTNKSTRLVGDVTLSGIKLNQLLIAPYLSGSMDISPHSFKLVSAGRVDEHLHAQISDGLQSDEVKTQALAAEGIKEGVALSLQRGQLHMALNYRPEQSAKLEIRNLPLDELEIASLRGSVPKAEVTLNLQKRRGHGSLSVRRPRFSGLQGESLDVAARWSGDVVTLEKSVLEQANSRYELQGEYVLPRPRSAADKGRDDDGTWEKAMGGHLGSIISSMGRWRLRLDVPRAEVSEMLPVARLLSRSTDPAVVSRSKELFLQGVQNAGFSAVNLKQHLEYIRRNKVSALPEDFSPESMPLPGLAELKGQWHGSLEASGGGNGDTTADFDLRGEDWEWGAYKTQKVIAIGDYSNNDSLRLENFFIQKDAATLHADGTLFGPKPNLHFAVLNFPIGLVPPLLHAFKSAPEPSPTTAPRSLYTPIKGILYMEGDLRGNLEKPQCDVQIRLLDGAVGGISLGRSEVAASITSANRLAFNAVLEPATHSGHVRVRGSLPMGPGGMEDNEEDKDQEVLTEKRRRGRGRGRERNRDREEEDAVDKREAREKGGDEGWEVRLAESLKALDGEFLETGAVQVDAAVKDGGMMLLTAISPGIHWLQGNADITLKIRGTVNQPVADGVASFQKVAISSPVLPRPLTNLGGTISVKDNQLCVEGLEGRVGRRGHLQVKGKLPFKADNPPGVDESIEVKAESLEVRTRNAFNGQVDSQIRLMGSFIEPEVTGVIKLSHGEAYLSQEKGANNPALSITSSLSGHVGHTSHAGHAEEVKEENNEAQLPIAVRLRALKLQLGPELRMVYPLILNFAVSGELELNGFADSQRVKPKGTLTFENGDVNLVATQVRLNRDHPNRAKFEPEQGLDPSLDLALVGADWQLKVQGRARNWQDNLVITSTRSGEQDAFTRIEAARVFESQLAESLLEGDGQLAFKKLAAATVETLMPKIEGKGEFGQARWRLVSAPQIPNLLSLDPTTDPFKSLANLSFGTEVEVQLGKHLQASVVRQLKESEMATQWTLLYQLNSKLRLLFSSIPSVDNRILFEYSATSQN